jgi:hypothetical protein
MQSKSKQATAAGGASKLDKKLIGDPRGLLNNNSSPDYKVDLSSGTKPNLGSLPTPSLPSVSATSIPSASAEKSDLKLENKPEIPDIKKEVKAGSQKKPLIVFIKGMDFFSSPSKSERGYAGVGKMAEAIDGSRIYGWDQKNEIIDEIVKTHPDFPVILIGHSLGGDTAVEIADELDSLEHKFRKVDLLVTIDSVGFQNDIIPQNVKSHLNVFGENDLFFNDDPHVARRNEKTNVMNILSPLDHTDLDDDKEIQYEIVNLIQKSLGKNV